MLHLLKHLKSFENYETSDDNLLTLDKLLNIEEKNINSIIPNTFFNSYKTFQRVKYLSLSNNKLNKIDNIDMFSNLEMFDCSNNYLTTLPKLPNSIIELACRNNEITNISNLTNYTKLIRLDCSFNNITFIPSNLQLKILYCCNNKIQEIPTLNNLITLYATNNNINIINKMPQLNC